MLSFEIALVVCNLALALMVLLADLLLPEDEGTRSYRDALLWMIVLIGAGSLAITKAKCVPYAIRLVLLIGLSVLGILSCLRSLQQWRDSRRH